MQAELDNAKVLADAEHPPPHHGRGQNLDKI
jgi:hypothetical protein